MKSPERWQHVKEILYAALGMEADERVLFLNQKCGDDVELRREIESLIQAHGNADRFESPAIEKIADVVSATPSDGMVGRSLEYYEIIRKIAAGGMGEIYLARDSRLDRKVALKVLPQFYTQHPDRLRRFQQEARAASALNHPNILTVHEIGSADSVNYIATEFVDGTSLRERLVLSPLSITEAIEIATQVANALAAAHEAGIIHRDIKPENIMVRRDGIVKVVDFGLAKLAPRPTSDSEGSTMVNTGEGVVMGTAQYMSPEQARGASVDARTDLWSLGCVLYEMLAGRSPFAAPTPGDVIVSILERDPPSLTRPEIPPELEWIVKKALRKERDERYQTAKELLSDIRGLGHRLEFEAEVERTGSPEANVTRIAARDSDAPAANDTIGQPAAHPTSSAEYLVTGIKRHKLVSSLALVAIAIAVTAAVFFYPRSTPALTEKDTVLISDFVNTTGDPVFDGTLKQALAVQLGQSPFINILPDQRVSQALRYMERAQDERITKEIGREICQREGLKALLAGSIASVGTSYVITLEALNGQTGDSLAMEQAQAESKEQVIGKLGEAATRLREKLGESLSSIQKFDAPLVQATTSSLDALKAYVMGREIGRTGNYLESIPHFKRAIELDPNFAIAYTGLAVAYFNENDPSGLATQYATKAFELRDRVTEPERLRISELYYSIVTDERDKRMEVLELSNRTYPGNTATMNNLAVTYHQSGQYERSVQVATEAISIDPDAAVLYGNLGWAYMGLGRYEEAKATFEQAYARNLHFWQIHANHYLLAVGRGDEAEMQRQLEWASGKPSEYIFLEFKSWAEMLAGRARRSSEAAYRSVELAQSHGLKSDVARVLSNLSAWHALLGNCRQARAEASKAIAETAGSSLEPISPLGPALCGDFRQMQTIIDDLERRTPLSTEVNVIWGPASRAAAENYKGNPAEAIRILEKTRPYELGSIAGFWPTYIRAQAYLRQGSAAEAMAEFQKIIDRRGVWPAAVHYPLAHLGVARAAALAGDTAKSRKAYQDFLALWKDADPEIPILLQAKKEYEKLVE